MNAGRTGALLVALIAGAIFAGCAGGVRIAPRTSPHEQYAAKLRSAGLDKTTLGQQWQMAADAALRAAAPITSPFSESGYFPADESTAVAYRLELARGRRLAIDVSFESSEPGQLFIDLFRIEANGDLRRVASLDDQTSMLEYEVDRSGTFVLRVQPELLRTGRFVLTERTLASLRTFPVSGQSHRAIQSQFGAVRDSGARSHEGVDIFAPRGTPVLAVADGVANNDTNTLGGNVVWLRSGLFGNTYYYAHLDRWEFDGSKRVREGDVIGYVGDTGNARATSPHLHFGIYDGGAIDPSPFLQPDEPLPSPVRDDGSLGALVRTRALRTVMREGPSASAAERAVLDADSLARRLGVAGTWHRVGLPDRSTGYITATALTGAATPLRRERAARDLALRERPRPDAPIVAMLAANQLVEMIGRFEEFEFVRPAQGHGGWVPRAR